jgi:hypothetical protein
MFPAQRQLKQIWLNACVILFNSHASLQALQQIQLTIDSCEHCRLERLEEITRTCPGPDCKVTAVYVSWRKVEE